MPKKKKPTAPLSLLEAARAMFDPTKPWEDGSPSPEVLADLRAAIAAHEANIPGDPMKLARMIEEEFGERIQLDQEISGADAVDFIVQRAYPEALAICQDDDNRKEGR